MECHSPGQETRDLVSWSGSRRDKYQARKRARASKEVTFRKALPAPSAVASADQEAVPALAARAAASAESNKDSDAPAANSHRLSAALAGRVPPLPTLEKRATRTNQREDKLEVP